MLTQTETVKRLRDAANLARETDRDLDATTPSAYRVEVGFRAVPVYSTTAPSVSDVFADGDDLDDFGTITDAGRHDQARHDGYVAHLYFSTTGDYGELVTVVTVWTGNGDGPVVIHCP